MKAQAEMERRVFPIEVRRATEADSGKMPTLTGYAAMFNRDSEEMYGITERIAPGAFRKTLKDGATVKAFWNHDSGIVMGSTRSGTLRLVEDKTGLSVEIDPPDTPTMRDRVASIERGDVDQMSFGFQTVKDSWEYNRVTDTAIRTLLEVRLFEVSPVAIPAYPDTRIEARCKDKLRELREQETEPEPRELAHSEPNAGNTSDDEQAARLEAEALDRAEAEALLLEVQIAQSTL